MAEQEYEHISLEHRNLCDQCHRSLPELDSMPKREFLNWLWNNEELFGYFRRFAIDARNRGRRRFSVYMIRERVRWYVNVESNAAGEFKISNNLTPYIARALLIDDPRFEGFFDIKGPE